MQENSVPETPWKTATAQRKSRLQEQRNGELPGGSKQINSGRTKFSKRDNRLSGFLVESRRTDGDSYRISAKEFRDVTIDALNTPPGMLPGMQIDLEDGRTQLFVCRLDDHLNLLAQARVANDE